VGGLLAADETQEWLPLDLLLICMKIQSYQSRDGMDDDMQIQDKSLTGD